MQADPVTVDNEEQVAQLNSFLRGEISAVETYNQVLAQLKNPVHELTLQHCLRSHEERVRSLSDEIRRLGGVPVQGSGVWGAFAKLVEGGAQLFGERAAIAVLEEGEDHGRDDYRRDLDSVGSSVRRYIEQYILPMQEQTHRTLSELKQSMKT